MDEDFQTKLLNLLLRHCVNITAVDRTPGNTALENDGAGRCVVISGFVMAVNGHWFFVTAGHCLQKIEESRDAGQVYEYWRLDDGTRPESQDLTPIPFDYDSAPKFSYHDEETGVDYACIYLRAYYRTLLEKNGICPFLNAWARDVNADHLKYFLLGVPSETIQTKIVNGSIYQRYNPYIVALTRIAKPEGVLVAGDWFYAKLPEDNAPPVQSIEGMSGGPILGFANDSAGNLRYWLLALQSGWDPKLRVIRGCPTGVFAQWLEFSIEKVGTQL